jgi:hypothetical protein
MALSSSISMRLSPGGNELLKSENAWYWAFSEKIKLIGNIEFAYNQHEFQMRPMSIRPPEKVVRKATQGTFSEGEILNSIHGLRYSYYKRGVMYLMPSKDKIADFGKSRFNPLIKGNPEAIGRFIRDTDSATIKKIGSGFLYFRSGRLSQDVGGRGDMKSSAALKGDPADHAVLDEFDEMDQGVDEFVDSRMAKSDVGTKTYIANPTLPDYMSDKKFQASSQEYWHIKCGACGKYTCMDLDEYWNEKDLTSTDKILKRLPDGAIIRVCCHCGKRIDPRLGEWVAAKPSVKDIIGFTIGHPSYPWMDLRNLLNSWQNLDVDRANFIRLRLGRPYIEAENRLSIQDVYNCCGNYGMSSSETSTSYMGVDQGGGQGDLFHIVIGKKHPAKKGQIVFTGIEKGWLELDTFMKRFNVGRCVIDGLPNQEDARAFAKRFPGKVFLSYFSEHQKGDYTWNEKDFTVTSYRTDAMDASHKEIANQDIVIPQKSKIIELYAKHCHATAKKLEKDEKTGSQRYIYIPKLGGPDHFRLAQCYETMARNGAPINIFSGLKAGSN